MKQALVTGATGFVGLNLVQALIREGWNVCAIHRASSDLSFIKRFDVSLIEADTTDAASLDSVPEGLDAVFHVAASTNFWFAKNDAQTRVNIDGTRNVLEAAQKKGAKRFVHTSSVAAYGPEDGDVLHEDMDQRGSGHWINYVRTKYESEQLVLSAATQNRLHASVIQPGNILGQYDLGSWSRMFSMIKQGKLPGSLPGAGPWCHVNQVVDAHIKAAELAPNGQTYLIGAQHATYESVLARIAALLGKKAPKKLPSPVFKAVAGVGGLVSRFTHKEPDLTPEMVYLASIDYRADCTKAQIELGYNDVSIDEMLADVHR